MRFPILSLRKHRKHRQLPRAPLQKEVLLPEARVYCKASTEMWQLGCHELTNIPITQLRAHNATEKSRRKHYISILELSTSPTL